MATKKGVANSQIGNIGTTDMKESDDEATLQDLLVAVKGMSGTKITDGDLGEEYNPELVGQQ